MCADLSQAYFFIYKNSGLICKKNSSNTAIKITENIPFFSLFLWLSKEALIENYEEVLICLPVKKKLKLDIPYVRLESQKNFPISSFPRLWNEIIIPNTEQNDDNVEQNFTFREIMSRKQFASKLKLLLLDNLTLVCSTSRDNCSECNQ